MRRTIGLLLLLASMTLAERQTAEFRLKKDATSPMRGWILEYDDAGFRFERFGGGGRMHIRWTDLLAKDASKLRQDFGLELTEEERLGLIDGHEMHFKGGGSVRGLFLGKDEDGTHRMKVEGLELPYPKDRIRRIDEVQIKEDEAFSPEEVYLRRVERFPPNTAIDHKRLGDYLYDIGNWQGAENEYKKAIGKDPVYRTRLEPRLGELHDYMEDAEAASFFAKQKSDAVLNGRWKRSIGNIRAYGEENRGAQRRAERLIEEIEEKWREKKRARFHRVKNEEMDRAIRNFLAKEQPDLATARNWATSQLEKEVTDRIQRRLDMDKDELEMLLESKSKGAPHWATYWAGTFIVSKRAKVGKSTKRRVRGDPDKWWYGYRDVSTRATWLKAYAAERLDLFKVVRITTRDCERCGGTGRVRKLSFQSLADGRHEWKETCPRCFGAAQDRGVAYR